MSAAIHCMLLPWAKVLLVVSRNVIDEVKVKFNGVIGFGCFFSLLFFFSSLSSLLLFVKFNKTHTKHKTRNKTTKQETKQKKTFALTNLRSSSAQLGQKMRTVLNDSTCQWRQKRSEWMESDRNWKGNDHQRHVQRLSRSKANLKTI